MQASPLLLQQAEIDSARIVHHGERAANHQVVLEHAPRAAIEAARVGAHLQAAELYGAALPYVGALFTLNPAAIETIKGMDNGKGKPMSELIQAEPVVAEVKKLVARINRQLAPFEQIRKHHILDRDFTIETGELTPTMKIRRSRVLENHRKAVATLYGSREELLAE